MNTSTDSTRAPSESTTRTMSGTVEHLATAECWRLIEARSFGRLAVEGLDGMPDVFPLNYTVHDGSIYISSAPGSKLMAIAVHPVAAFEIDGEDDGFHLECRPPWRGAPTGDRQGDPRVRREGPRVISPTAKYNYICVTPSIGLGPTIRRSPSGRDSRVAGC